MNIIILGLSKTHRTVYLVVEKKQMNRNILMLYYSRSEFMF